MKKKEYFFYLSYSEYNLLRHNLGVMHIEKNIYDNLIGALLNIDGKSIDNLKACLDLKEMGIRHELHPKELANGEVYIPPVCYAMFNREKDLILTFQKNIKILDGYASNISICVNLKK